MDRVLNIKLLKNPFNWVIVLLMVLLGFLCAEIVFKQFSPDSN